MSTVQSYLPRWLDRLQPSKTAVLLGTAVAVGIGTGLGAVFFIWLIGTIETLFFGQSTTWFGGLGRWLFILIPAVGGLLGGPIIAYFAPEAKGHGVPEVMQAIALQGGRMRPRVVIAKVIASALCIGSGGSAGREGPIVQVGATLGSVLGQWFRLSEMRIRNLVACGAAAGIAATFNAPIAGVIFAMEIILGELHLGDLGNVVISSVTAATVARVFLGDRPAFTIPLYSMKTPWEIFLYALLGVLAAMVGVGFIKLLYWFEDRFDTWQFPDALKPAIGGLLLGGLGFLYPLGLGFVSATPLSENIPHVFGAGFSVIEGAILGQLSFSLLFVLIFLKPLATSFTLGSGNSGGVFAPALFTGAALGGALGRLLETILPGATAGPGAFAVVGMAAVFAAAARAPFTAILIVFEMTDDYRMIVPLMAGVIVSLFVAERLMSESVYTLKLKRRGIHLKRGQDVDVMQTVQVHEVMVREPVTVAAALPVTQLGDEFLRTGRHGFAVLDEAGLLVGVVSLQDYRRVITQEPDAAERLVVGDIATREIVSVHPDDTVEVALKRMAPRDLSRLPVVAAGTPQHLIGMIRRNDIVRAYEIGAMRREEARQQAEQVREMGHTQARFVEVKLEPDSSAVGKTVAELCLPRKVVLVSVRRGRDLLLPHGDTQLQAGDTITALCENSFAPELRSYFVLAPSSVSPD